MKRELVLAIDESLCPEIACPADREILFDLALPFGLEEDPPDAVARAIGLVESIGRDKRIGTRFRARSRPPPASARGCPATRARASHARCFTKHVPMLRALYPERSVFQEVSDETRRLRAGR